MWKQKELNTNSHKKDERNAVFEDREEKANGKFLVQARAKDAPWLAAAADSAGSPGTMFCREIW